jgi:hypothetical protein
MAMGESLLFKLEVSSMHYTLDGGGGDARPVRLEVASSPVVPQKLRKRRESSFDALAPAVHPYGHANSMHFGNLIMQVERTGQIAPHRDGSVRLLRDTSALSLTSWSCYQAMLIFPVEPGSHPDPGFKTVWCFPMREKPFNPFLRQNIYEGAV